MNPPDAIPVSDALTEQALALCELVASERPSLLGYLVATLRRSPSAPALTHLAGLWDVRADHLRSAMHQAATQLDNLEQRPLYQASLKSRFGDQTLHLLLLHDLASARAGRRSGQQINRLTAIARRFHREHQDGRARRLVEDFLGEKDR